MLEGLWTKQYLPPGKIIIQNEENMENQERKKAA